MFTMIKNTNESIWKYIDRTFYSPGHCWEWTGALGGRGGYPQITIDYTAYRVTRIICSNTEVVRHICDNTKCCNPSHLIAGTHKDNMKDMTDRKRQAKGHLHGMSKLTETQVIEIRSLVANGISQKDVATMFDVDPTNISCIITRKTWYHI